MEEKEKNDIQDAKVSEVKADEKVKSRSYHTEIILIFIIGLLLGIMAKAESLKTVSIGFSDYRLKGGAQQYDMDEIEKKLIEKSQKNQQEMQNQQEGQGQAPGQEISNEEGAAVQN